MKENYKMGAFFVQCNIMYCTSTKHDRGSLQKPKREVERDYCVNIWPRTKPGHLQSGKQVEFDSAIVLFFLI